MEIDSLSVPEFALLSGLNFHAPTKLPVTDDPDGDEGGFSWHIRNEAVTTSNVATVIVLIKSAPPTLEGNRDFTTQLLKHPHYTNYGLRFSISVFSSSDVDCGQAFEDACSLSQALGS
jgi:hypothetical protein